MQFSKWVTLGFGALCLVAVAGVLNAQHLYYMAAILLTLPGVSYALGWYTLRGLEFRRELPSTSWEGEEGDISYVAANTSRLSRFFLAVQEPLPAWIEPLDAEPPLFNVAAQDTARVVHRVRFLRRGVYRVQDFEVTAMDPLGVFAFTKRVECEGELVVYPRPQDLPPWEISGAERYGWQGFTASALRGSSVDPDGVRAYAPGDPLRRIHWRQTARTGTLSVIEFEETQTLNLVIVLDAQRGTEVGTGTDTTLEYAIRLIASLAQQAIQQGASVRLLVPQDTQGDSAPTGSTSAASVSGRGNEHLFLILDSLARVEANSLQPVGEFVGATAGSLLPGTSLVVVTARPDGALPGALARYTATGAHVSVVYIDPETFEGGKARISETARSRFFAELMAVGAHPFTLRHHEQGSLRPEIVSNVR